MIKTVNIGDTTVTLKTSAALPRMYRRRFNRDLFLDMSHIMSGVTKENPNLTLDAEGMEILEDVVYTFAKYADPENVPDEVEDWLEGFESFDIFVLIPIVLEMWVQERKTTGNLKKKNAKSTVSSQQGSSSTGH